MRSQQTDESMKVAGATIHALAAGRRREAYGAVALALVFACGASLLWTRLDVIAIGLGLIAVSSASRGAYLWRRAQDAEIGAAGEAGLQTLLLPLVACGWGLEVNVRLPGYGDVDALLVSPARRRYVIDAKMYGGAVAQRGDTIVHVRGREATQFCEDLIGGVLRQAELVARRRGGRVFPLLCFMQAALMRPLPGAVRGVAVVDARCIVDALMTLDADG